jgi:hypothetical protein
MAYLRWSMRRLQLVGESDAPRTGCQPLAGDNAIAEEAMDGRRNEAEFRGRLLDVHKLARRQVLLRHEARDLPARAQARYAVAVEAQAARRSTALPIEDAGDDGVGMVLVQPRLMAKPSR